MDNKKKEGPLTKFWNSIAGTPEKRKTLTRYAIYAVLIIIIIMCMKQCKRNADDLRDMVKIGKLKDQEIKYWQDENGKTHAQVQQISASKKVIEYYFKKQIDSMADVLNVKSKQIKEFDKIVMVARGSGAGKVITRDSIVYVTDPNDYTKTIPVDTITRQLHLDDGYLAFNGYIKKNDNYNYDYTYKDVMVRTVYYKKSGFLGLKKTTFVDFALSNPNAKVTGITQFKIEPKDVKRFGIGPFIGYGWTGKGFGITAGISLQYNLIRF